jgi:phage tail sheath protein FI
MGNIHSSAGVYVNEDDRSLRATNAPTSIGAIVGESHKGPVGQRVLITDTAKFIDVFGKPDAAVSFMHYSALAFLEESSRLYVTRVAPNSLYGGLTVSVVNNLNQSESWIAGEEDPTIHSFNLDDLFIITGANQGTWTSELRVDIYPNTQSTDNTFFVDVYQANINRPLERHLVHLNYYKNGFGVQVNIEEYINKHSSLIRVVQNRDNPAFIATPNRQFINTLNSTQIAGGDNGTVATTGQIMLAWDLYKDVEQLDVNILINGGYTDVAIQAAMNTLAVQRADCIAILDTPATEQSVSNAISFRRNDLQIDTSYAALYAPDYFILDKYSDRRLYVPPSGFIAAAYARTDREFDTWWAPAGPNRGKLSVLGVRYEYNQGDRDALVDNQVNPTRVIRGTGIRIWGADTLQVQSSALSNVSVRRLMLFLEKSLSLAVLYSVFDPNDSILRSKLVEICTRFLKPIKNGRGLYWFEAVCDDTNNPPEIVAGGDLILDVYIDPVLPVKRIHLNAIVNKTGVRFNLG